MRIKGTLNLEQIQIIKRSGGSLKVGAARACACALRWHLRSEERFRADARAGAHAGAALCFGVMISKESLLSPSYRL